MSLRTPQVGGHCVRGYTQETFGPSKKEDGLSNGDISSSMFLYKLYYNQSEDSMKVVSLLLMMALLMGYSTSTAENSFSVLNRIGTDRRRK